MLTVRAKSLSLSLFLSCGIKNNKELLFALSKHCQYYDLKQQKKKKKQN